MSMVDEEKTMKTVSEIKTAILNGNFSNEEIRILSSALNLKFREMQSRATHSFSRGDKVQFMSKRGLIKGTVTRVNQKTVSVQAFDGVQWKVSGSLLSLRD